MDKNYLYQSIESVEKIANASKFSRFKKQPVKYGFAILFRYLVYPLTKKEIRTKTTSFFKKPITVALPASTDIYLTGSKSHSSEIRLSKYLINHVESGDNVLDIGAHIGFFSKLVSELIGSEGKVIALEPSHNSFNLLLKNVKDDSKITVVKKAVSDKSQTMTFYEFPNLQSEFNSSDISQYESEKWFNDAKPKKVEVEAVSIDDLCHANKFKPNFIKIDVEGGEFQAIKGGVSYLSENKPVVILEYLNPERHNQNHQKAANLLSELGFKSHIIDNKGNLQFIKNLDQYLEKENLESDNIVFLYQN